MAGILWEVLIMRGLFILTLLPVLFLLALLVTFVGVPVVGALFGAF